MSQYAELTFVTHHLASTTPWLAASPDTMPVPAPTCKGYTLYSQHPSTPAMAKHDPYAIVPCPHPPSIPAVLSAACAESNRKRSCKQAVYCEMHHCGRCRKAWKAVQHGPGAVPKVVEGGDQEAMDSR